MGPGLSPRHSKKAKKEETKTNRDEVKVSGVTNKSYDDTDTMKITEETIKKKMYNDLEDTKLEVLKSFAIKQQQIVKLEAALNEANKMFETYDTDMKSKDETIQTLEAEIESLKAKELENNKSLKAEIKSLKNKNFEEEFRANQVEDSMEMLRQEMADLQEEKNKIEEELKTSREAVKSLESVKQNLLTENQNLNIEIKQVKDDSSQNADVQNRIESLEHELETEAEERQTVVRDLEKYQLQCEDLGTKLKEKTKEMVELQVKSQEREAALSKCQWDFIEIQLKINEFLEIKKAKESEFSRSQANYSELMKKYQDLQKSKSEESSLMNKKLEEARKTRKENKLLIEQLRSECESDLSTRKLEDKVTALKRDLARLTEDNVEANKAAREKEKEVRLAEGKLLTLETERREEREKIQSLEEKLKERDAEREKLERELKDSSKRLQRKKDLIKKIEKKSHERKMKLKRYQEASFSDKARKDISRKDKVLTLKCLKLVLNGEENSTEQIKLGKLTPSDKQNDDARELADCGEKSDHLDFKTNNKKPSGSRIDTSIPVVDELLAESDDEQDKVHNDKDLKPLDVNLTCDDVSDTIGNQYVSPSQSYDTDVDLNETDELQKIQEFLENTEIAGNIIEDMISNAIEDQSPISASNTEKVREDIHEFYCNIRDAVRHSLLKYYQQEGGVRKFRILSETHFSELCRKFSHQFREELKHSYIGAGTILSEDDKLYISNHIDNYLCSI